jgi:glycerophosphoryl diester phosphodiesterase
MIKYLNILFFSLIFMFSCSVELTDVVIPDYGQNGILSETYPLDDFVKENTEGIYQVTEGKSEFGQQVVLKWSGEYLSIFAGRNAAYMIFKGGSLDSVIIFEGYWRFATGSETGLMSLHIKREEGGSDLVAGRKPKNIIIRGLYGTDTDQPEEPFVLEFEKELKKDKKDFWIVGHRGGGRNSDRLSVSENSVEIIKQAERLGANSIEIDVKLTKDKVPVLFHDENLSLRLINESYMIGELSNYTFAQLRTFCTLKNGERIPTLMEALDIVIESTKLKLVWLDIKSEGLIEIVAKVQRDYLEKAQQLGRELEIMIGIPTEDVFDEYLNYEYRGTSPAICELSIDNVRKSDAAIWAPRWSLGIQEAEVSEMHSEKRRAFTWTLDEAKFIKIYLNDGDFDGILTNYPMILAYEYYIR